MATPEQPRPEAQPNPIPEAKPEGAFPPGTKIRFTSETIKIKFFGEPDEPLGPGETEFSVGPQDEGAGESGAGVPVPPSENPPPVGQEVPREPRFTDKQLFWQDKYRVGKLNPYQKDRPAPDWSPFNYYKNHKIEFLQHPIQNALEIDLALRGGADKEYNQLGSVGDRAKRMAAMVGNMVPFTLFDIVTSIPGNLFLVGAKRYQKLHEAQRTGDTPEDVKMRTAAIAAVLDGPRRGMEIVNDKITSAMGNWFVAWLTGVNKGWISEPSDKGGDFLDGAVGMYMEDAVNGPIVESFMHFLYEIPVYGALVEQGWTKLAKVQERSAFTKAYGKAIFGGLGVMVGTLNTLRELNRKEKMIKAGKLYKEPRSPSKYVAEKTLDGLGWLWKRTPWGRSA